MPGQRGTEKRAMDETVLVRMPGDLASAVKAIADAEGLTVAAWFRSKAVNKLGLDPALIRPSAPRSIFDSEDLEAIGSLSRRVSMANGAVVQLTKAVRENGSSAHADAEVVLADLRAIREDLTKVVETVKSRARRRD